MSGYGLTSAGAYANQKVSAIKPARRIRKEKKMKLSLKQRFRNWLNDTNDEADVPRLEVEESRLQSDGIRLQIYKASGGFVIETRGYDRKTDRSHTTMHVITDEQDLGDSLSKIVMMEAMR